MKYLTLKHLHSVWATALTLAVCAPVLAQAPAARTDADVIVTEAGGLIHCTVQSIGADGSVQIAGPWLKGQARVDLAGLRQIMLGSPAGRLDHHRVYITNGDIIEGNVAAVTAEHVKIASGPLGAVDIPRSVVERIDQTVGHKVVFETDFARDGMGPWKPVKGIWKIENGRLVCARADGDVGGVQIAAPLEHEGSLTVEYRYTGGGVYRLSESVVLYADGVDEKGRTRESLSLKFFGKGLHISRRSADKEKANGSNNLFKWIDDYVRKNTPPLTGDEKRDRDARHAVMSSRVTVTVRVACDLENGNVLLWVDGKRYVKERMMDMPTAGKFILIGDQWANSRTQYIRILQGVVPPPEKRAEAEKEGCVFRMKDGTRAVSPTFTLKDGQITAGRGDVTYAIALSDVQEIVMPKDGRTLPRSRNGDVWVTTERGRVSLRVTAMNGEHLTGSSDYLGDIRAARNAVKTIVPKPVVIPEPKTP